MDFKEIQELIKIFNRSNLTELKIEQNDFKIVIKAEEAGAQMPMVQQYAPQQYAPTPIQSAPAVQVTNTPSVEVSAPAPKAESTKGIVFKSPMIGTFYRTPGPDKEPFVKVGDRIEKGNPICIIEAMKLFNEIECEITGTVVKILVENASPVEYDQPLFIIEP